MERWVGKIAIVTGASSGIGAAVSRRLVEEGVIVAGLARRVERIEEHAKSLSNQKGKLYAIQADVSKEDSILAAFKWVLENLGPVSILVNNAGVYHNSPVIDGETELWRNTFAINVLGLCIATREAVKTMRDHAIDGHIIHINSIVGHKIVSGGSVYSSSKFAVTALTETLRQEFNQNNLKIKITSISPGVVDTEMPPKEMIVHIPHLKADDIADGVLYVLSTPPHVQVHELTIKPVGEKF